jgi:hypothetical protein
LIVYPLAGELGAFEARGDQGDIAGTFSVPPAFAQRWGYPSVAPDGSKVLLGNGVVMSIQGTDIGDIAAAGLTGAVWGDDSDHICGIGASGDALVETGLTGAAQVVSPTGTSLLDVLGCSPEADRAVVVEDSTSTDSPSAVAVIELSTGQVLASHPGAAGIVTHDCSLFAEDDAAGVTIRDVASWQVVAQVTRQWPSQTPNSTSVAVAAAFSWDGTRLALAGGIAGQPNDAVWVVTWSDDTTLYQSQDSVQVAQGSGVVAVFPVIGSSAFVLVESGGVYMLGADGGAQLLPG